MRMLTLVILALLLSACRVPDRVPTPAPLERLSTGSAVHAAVQLERVKAVERAIESGLPEQAIAVLAEIAGCEVEHEVSQAAQNAAARAEHEAFARQAAADLQASQEQVSRLEDELQSDTRRWWLIVSLIGGALFVIGSGIAIWFAGVRREGAMLASLGLLTTGFALGVLAILPWMKWIAIVCIGLALVVGMLILLRQRRIAERVVATTEAAIPLIPTAQRDAMFSGDAPLANAIQDPSTRAFVRQSRNAIHRGGRVSSRGSHRPATPGSQPGPAIHSSSLEINT